MIQVLRDAERLSVDPTSHPDLAELVVACARDSRDEISVIVELRVDGEEVSPDDPTELARFDLGRVRAIEMTTRPAREVAIESLEGSADYATALGEALRETADLLRAGRLEEANQLFATALDAFAVLLFAISAAGRLLRGAASELGELESELRPWLEAVAEAQQERDSVRMADYLEYEIRPRIGGWPSRIRQVADRLGAASPGAQDSPATDG